MTANKKYSTRHKISNILLIIVGLFWIYRGVVNFRMETKWSIILILFAVVLIAVNLSLLKDTI